MKVRFYQYREKSARLRGFPSANGSRLTVTRLMRSESRSDGLSEYRENLRN
jgi:hypothetical protein